MDDARKTARLFDARYGLARRRDEGAERTASTPKVAVRPWPIRAIAAKAMPRRAGADG